jgi:hypothetical protein
VAPPATPEPKPPRYIFLVFLILGKYISIV